MDVPGDGAAAGLTQAVFRLLAEGAYRCDEAGARLLRAPGGGRGGLRYAPRRDARYVRILARLPQTAMLHQRLRPAGLRS
jgi:hypothetical protein